MKKDTHKPLSVLTILLWFVVLGVTGCASKQAPVLLGPTHLRPKIATLESELNAIATFPQSDSGLTEKRNEALDYLDEFLEDHPESFAARYQRACWRLDWDMESLALEDVKTLEKLYGPQPEVSALGGVACYRLGRKRESREYFRNVLALDPQNQQALLYTGLMLAETGYHDQAEQYLARVTEIDPDNADLSCWSQALAWVSDPNDSLTIDRDTDPLLAKRVGILLVHNGRLQEGIRALIVALRANPDDIEILMPMAHAFAQRNMLDNAIDLLGHVVTLEPDNGDAWMDLGSCYSQAGRLDDHYDPKARDCFLRVAELRPHQSEPLHAAAKASARMGDLLGAMEHYDAALKVKPCSVDLYLDYGLFLANNDQLLEAETLYREAMDLYPQDARIVANLMVIEFQIGRFEEARQLREALAQQEDLPTGVRRLLARYEGGER